jgi:thiamine pyrophosphokinase
VPWDSPPSRGASPELFPANATSIFCYFFTPPKQHGSNELSAKKIENFFPSEKLQRSAKKFMGKHYLIVGNGNADFANREKLKPFTAGRTVIALDGAANFLRQIGIVPDLTVGDCDSLTAETAAFLAERGGELLTSPCQDTTDLEKALIHVGRTKCSSVIVLHALGGRQDHALGNIFFLKKYAQTVPNLSMLTTESRIFYLESGTATLRGAAGSPCGFFGLPRARVTSRGLRYEMRDYWLELGAAESVANSFCGEEAQLTVTGHCLAALAFCPEEVYLNAPQFPDPVIREQCE